MYKNLNGNWFYREFDRIVCTLKLLFSKCAYLLQRYRSFSADVFVLLIPILARRGVFSPSKTAKTLEWGGVGGGEAGGGIASIKHTISTCIPGNLTSDYVEVSLISPIPQLSSQALKGQQDRIDMYNNTIWRVLNKPVVRFSLLNSKNTTF